MRLHGLALLASTSLALANITACDARGSGGINTEVDAGGGGSDVPVAPTDMGTVTPTDNGTVTPTDNGTVTPTDNGVATCAAPRTMCGSECVDRQSDPAHCGACGRACTAAQVCNSGSCQSTSTCTAPRTVCDGACVNTRTDIENCGACGTACAGGQFCNNGACMSTSTSTCTAPRVACDGVCVNTRTDGSNCGSCGTNCAAGQFCSDGACRSTSECAAPRLTCGASCIDVTTDVFNCGECNRRCGAGQTCTSGRCVGGTPTCPAGFVLCGSRCVDVTNDSTNCGACGVACGSGTICTTGACTAVATDIAAGSTCTGTMCGPGDALTCATSLLTGGYCTAFCLLGTTASEADQCGGPGSTCVAHPPFADIPDGQGICGRACNPRTCRAGTACTSFWYNTPATEGADSPGCFAHCQNDAQCAGVATTTGALNRCNTRTGRCAPAPVNLALAVDGDPCNPASTSPQCRGLCFPATTSPTQGVCGSFINLAATTSCPDNPAAIVPLGPGDDDLAICVFKTCAHNSECTSPLRCVYPESLGSVRNDLAGRCSYVSALQPTGIP